MRFLSRFFRSTPRVETVQPAAVSPPADEAIKKMLAEHEGVIRKPYRDTVGKLTIGIGRNLDDVGLSDDEIDFLFRNDLKRARSLCEKMIPSFPRLSVSRQHVLLDMAFNLGGRLLAFTKFLAALEAGHYGVAATEMMLSKWAGQVGQRAVELADMMRRGE